MNSRLPIFLFSFLFLFNLKAGTYSAELDTSKYFNEYFYSLTNDGNTEVGTFEVNNYTRESTKIWDPLVAIVLNRIIKYILPVNSIVASGKTIETTTQVAKGISVIGARATYRQFAKNIGAKFLNVTDDSWTWSKNEKFLEGVVQRGDDVIFAGKYDPNLLDKTSVLAKEIQYLENHGYQWTTNFTKMIFKK